MKSKVLSLIIAVTMIFSTAGFAFAAEEVAADLNAEIAKIEAEIEEKIETIKKEPEWAERK